MTSLEQPACPILSMASSMFLVTFLVGYLPTKLSAPERVMNLIAIFGAGLLVGAALIVIVPEGMSVLYQSIGASESTEAINRYVGASLVFGFIVMLLIDQGFKVIQENANAHSHQHGQQSRAIRSKDRKEEEGEYSVGAQITPPTSGECEPLTRDKTQEDTYGYDSISRDNEEDDKYSFKVTEHQKSTKNPVLVTTIGMVIHCVADGLALGTSVYLSQRLEKQSSLGFIVYLAILLHKAPGAIGFGTYLEHTGLSGFALAKHLLAFTLACPVSSIVTYYAMYLQQTQTNGVTFWVGILLIVSAGSFLYVATLHILPEVLFDQEMSHGHSHSHGNNKLKKYIEPKHYSKAIELAGMIIGLVLPLGLTFLEDE
ncbi:hypothetical protein FGO68_gene15252 [Halteria grandinella]|uniref:Zinc/iron permease n=1 Tax=Halteria grandinella TaxID=5974 RepID=A0A8J8NT74_HALGN|nr:hypothetical protein FGO68_gene15252 [Halteria grandinella]